MGLVVLWIMFGAVCSMIAGGKGLPSWPWFFWGLLFGPFALVLVLTKPSLAAPPLKKGMKKCPFCAEEIKMEAVVCKHCKRDIPFEFLSAPAEAKEVTPEVEPPAPAPEAAPPQEPVHYVQWSNIPDEEIEKGRSQ